MVEKIHQIKKSRLKKEDAELFILIEKLEIKKYKNIHFLISNYNIFCEIDDKNSIIWVDYDLFDKNYRYYINWLKVKDSIGKYFNIETENYKIFSYSTSYRKKVYYLGKPRKINFLYYFICFFKKNILSLSKINNI